jgi:DNA-directed RNA polymerase subunit omega
LLYPSLSELLNHVNSRYLLVNIISHRARELSNKSERTGNPLSKKAVSLAIDEIATGNLHYSIAEPEDASL